MLDNAIQKTLKPLFEFETIFDLDYTMIELVKTEFPNSKYFTDTINEDPITLRILLRNREDKNPLSIILKEEYLDSAFTLYRDILDSYMTSIYVNCHYTTVANYVASLSISDRDIIYPTIICRNKYEELAIQRLDVFKKNNINFIKPDKIDLDYTAYFIKYAEEFKEWGQSVERSSLFFADYGFNADFFLGEALPKDWILEEFRDKNEVYTIGVYSDIPYPQE